MSNFILVDQNTLIKKADISSVNFVYRMCVQNISADVLDIERIVISTKDGRSFVAERDYAILIAEELGWADLAMRLNRVRVMRHAIESFIAFWRSLEDVSSEESIEQMVVRLKSMPKPVPHEPFSKHPVLLSYSHDGNGVYLLDYCNYSWRVVFVASGEDPIGRASVFDYGQWVYPVTVIARSK